MREGLLKHDTEIERVINDIVDVNDTWEQSLIKMDEAIKRKEIEKTIHKNLNINIHEMYSETVG